MQPAGHIGRTLAALAFSAATLAACAPMVESTPATLATATAPRDIEIRGNTTIALSTGYSRRLEAGGRWREMGRLPEGAVFRPLDSVFSIEGRQAHEAWLVIDGTRLVGFYLPGEHRYSTLDPAIQLNLGGL